MEKLIHLCAHTGKFLSANDGGGGPNPTLRGFADWRQGWETFLLATASTVLAHGTSVTLAAWRGQYVCAENGGGGAVLANRAVAAAWETFTLERADGRSANVGHGDAVCFKTSSGKYLRFDATVGVKHVVADATSRTPEATFRLELLHEFQDHPRPALGATVRLFGDAKMTKVETFEMAGKCSFEATLVHDGFGPARIRRAQLWRAQRGGWFDIPPYLLPSLDGAPTFYGIPAETQLDRRKQLSDDNVDACQHLLFALELTNEVLLAQLPVSFTADTVYEGDWKQAKRLPPTPPAAPAPLDIPGPVLFGVLGSIDAWPASDGSLRVGVTAQLVNTTGRTLSVSDLRATVADDAGHAVTVAIPHCEPQGGPSTPAANQVVTSPAPILAFNVGITAPPGLDRATAHVRLHAHYRTAIEQADVERLVPIEFPELDALLAPIGRADAGAWNAGNGPRDDEFDSHNGNLTERFAYDLGIHVTAGGTTTSFRGDEFQNASYYAWRHAHRAMAAGYAVTADDHFDDNPRPHGDNPSPPPAGVVYGQNNVVIQHDAPGMKFSVYAHVRKGGKLVNRGDRVLAGQRISELGNSGGSSEPHLHIAYWKLDERTGHYRSLPMRWSNITLAAGGAVPGVLLDGTKFQVNPRAMTVTVAPANLTADADVPSVTFRTWDADLGQTVPGARVLCNGADIGPADAPLAHVTFPSRQTATHGAHGSLNEHTDPPEVKVVATGYQTVAPTIRWS